MNWFVKFISFERQCPPAKYIKYSYKANYQALKVEFIGVQPKFKDYVI